MRTSRLGNAFKHATLGWLPGVPSGPKAYRRGGGGGGGSSGQAEEVFYRIPPPNPRVPVTLFVMILYIRWEESKLSPSMLWPKLLRPSLLNSTCRRLRVSARHRNDDANWPLRRTCLNRPSIRSGPFTRMVLKSQPLPRSILVHAPESPGDASSNAPSQQVCL